jgi:hypothetical protein
MRIVALSIALFAAAQATSVDAVLAKLDAYLEVYEPRLSELIADELMIQDIEGRGRMARGRTLKSEVAFIALPNDAGWLGFRNVLRVDRRDVGGRASSLSKALAAPGYDAARALLSASAEHNLGLPRTNNLPNLPLEFLHPRNRRRFEARLDGDERIRGVAATRLVFQERLTPTLIQTSNGGDLPSVVRAWIDPKDGRVLRAEVRTFRSLRSNGFESKITVEFEQNRSLELLVPVEMRETFPQPSPLVGTSFARYSNFRRFQTSARIVPPQ